MKQEIRDKRNLEKYVQQMIELKARLAHLKSNPAGKEDRFGVENSALHIRKIIELFAFSLMSLQKEEYKKYRKSSGADFLKDWNGREILYHLTNLNPDMFFKPIEKEIQVQPDGVKGVALKDEKSVYTIKRLSKLYDRCGGILHVSNPWKNCNKIESFSGELPSITEKLLSTFEDQAILVNHWDSGESSVVIVTLTGANSSPSYHLALGNGNFGFGSV